MSCAPVPISLCILTSADACLYHYTFLTMEGCTFKLWTQITPFFPKALLSYTSHCSEKSNNSLLIIKEWLKKIISFKVHKSLCEGKGLWTGAGGGAFRWNKISLEWLTGHAEGLLLHKLLTRHQASPLTFLATHSIPRPCSYNEIHTLVRCSSHLAFGLLSHQTAAQGSQPGLHTRVPSYLIFPEETQHYKI